MKVVDLNRTLLDLTDEYPELVQVLADLGFVGIANPALRVAHGKVMTIRDGCRRAGLDLGMVVAGLERAGFSVLC